MKKLEKSGNISDGICKVRGVAKGTDESVPLVLAVANR